MSDSGDVEEIMNWNDYTVPQLKEELASRALETSGKKADLVARLEASDTTHRRGSDVPEQLQEEHEEDTNETEDTEFLVWNDEDQDAELVDGDDKKAKVSEKHDNDEEKGDGDGRKEDEVVEIKDDDDEEEEKPAKGGPAPDFSVDMAKDKDVLILTLHGDKINIPFKDEVQKDLKHFSRQQNIIMYPVEVEDIYSPMFQPFIESSINVSMELDETVPGKPIKGYLRLKFGSVTEATQAMTDLKTFNKDGRELTLKYFSEDDSEGHVLSKIKKEDADRKGPIMSRLLFVGNLPSDVDEATLKEHFVDALRAIIPCKEDTTERIG